MLPHDLPAEYDEDVAQLRRELEEALGDADEIGLTYDGMRLRASKIRTTRNETWAALRRIAEHPPALEQLGFNKPVAEALLGLGKREGLILICGGTGKGKTTTAASLLYHYLTNYGGVALTIEDPVEYLLDGRHGEAGLCYQIEIKQEEDWAEYLKRGLRWHPRYIMVGELRTPEAANQLLRAANSGHLVITTMHSGSLEEGLEGLLHLGEQAIGEHAPILLASGLTAVLYQNFLSHSIETKLYVTESHNLGDPVRALIRERHIGQATTFVDQQMARRDPPAT
jgi:twitching motility protein PilT